MIASCRWRRSLVALTQFVEPGAEQSGDDLELGVAARIRARTQVGRQRLGCGPVRDHAVLDDEAQRGRQAFLLWEKSLVRRPGFARDHQAHDPAVAPQFLESANLFVHPARTGRGGRAHDDQGVGIVERDADRLGQVGRGGQVFAVQEDGGETATVFA